MATLEEEFEAYKQTQAQSREFNLEQEYDAYKKDMAQGGSIRTAPVEPNLPIGATAGAIAGGFANPMLVPLFAAGGEAAQQLAERAMGSQAAPTSTGEAALRMGREALLSGAAEFAGGLPGRALHGGFFAGKVTPEGTAAVDFLERRGLYGGLLPAELTNSRILDIAHNVSEYSLLGGGAIKTFKENRSLFFKGLADEMIDRFGPRMSPEETGQAVIDSVHRNLEIAKAPAKLLYNRLEREAAPEYHNVIRQMKVEKAESPVTKSAVARMTVKKKEGPPSKEFIDTTDGPESLTDPELHGLNVKTSYQDVQVGERLERMRVMTTTAETQVAGPRIDLRPLKEEFASAFHISEKSGGLADREMGNTLMRFLKEKPDVVSYPVAKAIRTEIRTLRDTLERSVESKNAPAIAKSNEAYGKLTSQIRAGLKEYDPHLSDMWDTANEMTVKAHEQFNDRIIRSLIRRGNIDQGGKPEAIADALWRANNVTTVKKVRAAVDTTDWQKLQSVNMQRVFEKSFDDLGTPSGRKLDSVLFGPNGIGESALEAGYSKAFVDDLRKFTNTLKTVQEKQSEGTGRMLVQMKQGGAFLEVTGAALASIGLMSSDHGPGEALAGGGILITPFVLGHIMTSPTGLKWLTEGFSTAKHTARAGAIAAQLIQAGFSRPSMARDSGRSAEQQVRQPLQTRPFGENMQ